MPESRSIMRGLAILFTMALLVSLAAACSSGGGGGTTPDAGDTQQGDDASDADGAGGGGGDAALADLAGLAGEATEGVIAKVTYSVVTEGGGETFEGEWVLVQRPPDSRFEIAGTEGGAQYRTIIINVGDKAYLCTSAGGAESCLATPADDAGDETASLDALFAAPREIADDAGDVGLVGKSDREIAGVHANCFTVSGGLASLGDGEICFSDDGLLLLMRSDVNGVKSSFEATSVSMDVTDADFEPPYDVVDLSGLEDLGIPEP